MVRMLLYVLKKSDFPNQFGIIINMTKKSFEHLALEQDIERLAAEIKSRGLAEKGEEAVKTAVREYVRQPVVPSAAAGPTPKEEAPVSPLPQYLQQEPAEIKLKVEKLLDLVFHKGVKKAADEARRTNPIIADAFHDALTDKLYGELKTRGLLK